MSSDGGCLFHFGESFINREFVLTSNLILLALQLQSIIPVWAAGVQTAQLESLLDRPLKRRCRRTLPPIPSSSFFLQAKHDWSLPATFRWHGLRHLHYFSCFLWMLFGLSMPFLNCGAQNWIYSPEADRGQKTEIPQRDKNFSTPITTEISTSRMNTSQQSCGGIEWYKH